MANPALARKRIFYNDQVSTMTDDQARTILSFVPLNKDHRNILASLLKPFMLFEHSQKGSMPREGGCGNMEPQKTTKNKSPVQLDSHCITVPNEGKTGGLSLTMGKQQGIRLNSPSDRGSSLIFANFSN